MKKTKLFVPLALAALVLLGLGGCGGGGGGGGSPPPPEGSNGTLSLTNAPQDMGGSFVAAAKGTSAGVFADAVIIGWAEYSLTTHLEVISLTYELATGKSHVTLVNNDGGSSAWTCSDSDEGDSLCSGITVDKTAGTVTFTNQVLTNSSSSITLNGELKFTPPSGLGTSPSPDTLSGVAAVGQPIVNGAVQIKCAGGNALNTTTSATGAWQVTISGQTLPCAVQVSGGTINSIANTVAYHSIATSFGTVNVTPLTDLMLANLVGTATPNVWFAGLTPAAFTAITSAAVDTARSYQCAALSGLTPLCTTHPITTVFTATGNNIMEYMLIALRAAMTNAGISYTSLLSNASVVSYSAPSTNFNAALAIAYDAASIAPISATATSTARNLTVGSAMSSFSPLSAMGGKAPYIYSITSGTLPAGLSFNTSSGVVSGTPTASYATANLVFSVKDANNVVASTTSTVSFSVVAGGGVSGTAAQYFTKKAVGNTWTTLVTSIITPIGGGPSSTETSQYTDTITASSGGVVTFSYTYTGDNHETETGPYTSYIDVTGAWMVANNTGAYVMLPATFSVGTTWVSYPAIAPDHGAEYATVVAFNVTRTVPAGTFTDCLQIDLRQTDPNGDVFSSSMYFSPTAGTIVDETVTNTFISNTQTSSSQLQAGYIANP